MVPWRNVMTLMNIYRLSVAVLAFVTFFTFSWLGTNVGIVALTIAVVVVGIVGFVHTLAQKRINEFFRS